MLLKFDKKNKNEIYFWGSLIWIDAFDKLASSSFNSSISRSSSSSSSSISATLVDVLGPAVEVPFCPCIQMLRHGQDKGIHVFSQGYMFNWDLRVYLISFFFSVILLIRLSIIHKHTSIRQKQLATTVKVRAKWSFYTHLTPFNIWCRQPKGLYI